MPFVVKFQAQAPGVEVPAELRRSKARSSAPTIPPPCSAGWTGGCRIATGWTCNSWYSRLTGKNSNFESPQLDVAEEANYSRRVTSHAVKAGLVTTVSPTVVNEIRVQYAQDDRREEPNTYGAGTVINGFGSFGSDFDRPRFFEAHRFQITDSLTAVRRRHELRAGIDANITPSRQQQEGRILGRYDFTSLANYKAGKISRFRQTLPSSGPENLYYEGTQHELALFAQDRFSLGSRLSVNAGLRWEGQWNPQPPSPESRNLGDGSDSQRPRDVAASIRVDLGRHGRRADDRARQRGRLQRPHAGEPLPARVHRQRRLGGRRRQPHGSPASSPTSSYPNALVTLPPGVKVPPQRIFGFAADFQNPDTTAASATVEHRVTDGMQVSIGYVRNRTRHLQRRFDNNLFPPTIDATGLPVFPATRPDTTIAQLDVNESTARSEYDALILTAGGRRRAAAAVGGQLHVRPELGRRLERALRQPADDAQPLRSRLGMGALEERHAAQPGGHRRGHPAARVHGVRDPDRALRRPVHRRDRQRPAAGRERQQRPGDHRREDGRPQHVPAAGVLQPGPAADEGLPARGASELQLLVDVLNATRASNKNLANDSVSEFGTPEEPVETAGQTLYAPSTARFGGPRQVQLGVKVLF